MKDPHAADQPGARRRASRPVDGTDNAPSGAGAGGVGPVERPRVLVVHGQARTRNGLLRRVRPGVQVCEGTGTLEHARLLLDASEYDLVIVHDVLADGAGFDLVVEVTQSGRATRCLVTSDAPDLRGAGTAFAAGAVDYLGVGCEGAELRERILRAASVVRRERDRDERIEHIREACRTLNGARREMSDRVSSLCDDLVDAYNDLAEQMTHVTLATEFRSLVQQELDVEALLRTTLEYMLNKTGPTNAAVFLPTGHSDYSLGAYINYDIPRETVDMLLDHLADVIAPRFAGEKELILCRTDGELARWIGDDATWLSGSHLVSLTCLRNDEPLAVLTLFRDGHNPFPEDVIERFRVMSDIFGEQLSRIIRIHNRMLPEDQWPGFEFEEDDTDEDIDRGMAA
ncbi:MAG: hypothetical protein KDA21_07030 [Phycisphaerales bacterium]|nr:hypothetical protein [Phycisphaerales bacterium]